MSPQPSAPERANPLYATWAFLAFLVLGLGVLILILPVPWQSLRRRMVRRASRMALAACGMRLSVTGLEHLPASPCIVVANHGSYLDGVVLYAALPPTFGFVIKREMSRVPLANLLLRRIGSHYVDRGPGGRGARDTRKLLRRAHAGGSLAIFPEGTFQATPGLGPFRVGAFAIAARTGLPILPVGIRGTRAALPPTSLLPRRQDIAIDIAPLQPAPASNGEADVAAALGAVRQAILARIDEPDLIGAG